MDTSNFLKNSVINELGPKIYRYFCTSFERDKASDLTQETLIRLWEKVNQNAINQQKGDVITFAYGIAKNVKRETLKKIKHRFLLQDKLPKNVFHYDETLEEIQETSRLKQLRMAMLKLKENEREVLSLIIDEDLKLDDVSKLLKMPLGTVKSHIHRAKENLKRMLLNQIGQPK